MEHDPASAFFIDRKIEISQSDFNSEGTLLGGPLMKEVDSLAAIVAERHAGRPCVTRGIDAVRFLNRANLGDLLFCRASLHHISCAFMEVGVKVIAEDFRTLEQKDILSARFTFVVADEHLEAIEQDTLISRSNG